VLTVHEALTDRAARRESAEQLAVRPHDSTVVKVDSTRSPVGAAGQKYLASGTRVSMRMWEREAIGVAPETERDYEVVGYVLGGEAELHIEGQMVRLEPGDSYVVPRHARHRYRILAPFTAIEATSPPAEVHGRDELRAARARG
jgi:quercetin dioxygenase-like cupin family protein